MDSLNMRARIAGLLYLVVCIVGPVRLIYIPSVLFVAGSAPATAHNIAAHVGLMWTGIFCDLVTATTEVFLVLALYRLLGDVNRNWAITMLVLGLLDIPIYFMNTLNDVGAVLFARGAGFLSAFEQPQRDAMSMLFVTFHHYGVVINEVFWGLWLLPLGMLTYRSTFLPRILGVWLIFNGFAYLAQSVSGILFPQYNALVENITFPNQLGEVAFVLWLISMGARASFTKPATSHGSP
ncbi:MAG: DUF4386 domain-containing protein [Candidatus Baltobacteraceae bacterium]